MSSNYINSISGEKVGWRYGSGPAIYTERFVGGRLLSAAYLDQGVPVHPSSEFADVPSFDLVIDGESLALGWEMESFEKVDDPDGSCRSTLTLKHTLKPVTLKVITKTSGHGFFRRTLEITNTSQEKSLALTSVSPLTGAIWPMSDMLREDLRDNTVVPYSVGRFQHVQWGNEGKFAWQDVPLNTEIAFGSSSGRSGHSAPFFILKNLINGGYMVCHLAWSANWKMSFFSDFGDISGTLRLKFDVKPVGTAPMRVIAPGETVTAPEVHFGLSHDTLDTAVRNLHSYLRESVLKKVGDGLQPVIVNHWGFMQHEMSEDGLKAEIDLAAEIGAEMFIVDAGWYADKNTDWGLTTGNWWTGDRLPNDLFPVFDYAREKGIKVGLWVEIESAGKESKLAKEHPDWFITRYGETIERVLDLAKPEVREYVRSEIIRIIERYNLDLFRLDYNIDAKEGGFNMVAGMSENTLWRHVEAIYDIFDEVGERFPDLQLENCSSGGGRMDLGISSRFTTIWTSDWMRMPKTVRILNGMSLAYPPEYLDRMFGVVMEGSYRGSLDAQMHVIIMCHAAISGLTPSLAEANPEIMETVKKYIRIYKDFIRPFHRECAVYHHNPVVPGADGVGWCGLEYVSKDQKQAVAAVFRLIQAEDDTYVLRFRGLNTNLTYRLKSEPDGREATVSGYELVNDGLTIRLDAGLTSRLIMLSAE